MDVTLSEGDLNLFVARGSSLVHVVRAPGRRRAGKVVLIWALRSTRTNVIFAQWSLRMESTCFLPEPGMKREVTFTGWIRRS